MNEQDCGQLTLFQGDSPASRSAWPGSEEAVRTTAKLALLCPCLGVSADRLLGVGDNCYKERQC